MFHRGLISLVLSLLLMPLSSGGQPLASEDQPLQLPPVGSYGLRLITPALLEVTLVNTKSSMSAPPAAWNFISGDKSSLPSPADFVVSANDQSISVTEVGFRRRVLYAPLKERDLRIGNHLFLQLAHAVPSNASVKLSTGNTRLWSAASNLTVQNNPLRWSPAIHVNQVGYLPTQSKVAMVGYYLGNLGELDISKLSSGSAAPRFQLLNQTGEVVFEGELQARPDRGFPFTSYQRVFAADFTPHTETGVYRLHVPGLGVSWPFHVSEDVAGAWTRAYALGIYHQRCGTGNDLPFTRFTHGPCHTRPADIPNRSSRYENVNYVLGQETEGAQEGRHTARPLKDVSASLYPFVTTKPVDVRGGHHDAGDYSKYTENSANFIHLLVFAADNFPGVVALDNLGLPESGDGRSDILQEAKWEADFLAKMQDEDGGFYFLVYPRERRYENDVTPDRGDPQVVFPKTTAVTAAAVAALAQCASSPEFRRQFPEAASVYLQKARKGWAFLENAIAKHGKDGSYQKITHYGHDFIHDDELAWAACEMFLATGEERFADRLAQWLDPSDPGTRKWSWWRLFEAYGHAIRSFAFAEKSGRLKSNQLDRQLLAKCQREVEAAGLEQLERSENSAYGTSFPTETKRTRSAGWYFSSDGAFDLATALQLDYPAMNDPRPKLLKALIANINYEFGCNPANVSYLTGIGHRQQREVVHQYAQNDRRTLPLPGIPLGNIHDGFGWLDHYGKELGEVTFPPDDHPIAPYPMYDRWGDSFNLKQEFVISNQARGLAVMSWLMAQTALKTQAWKSASARIEGLPASLRSRQLVELKLSAENVDLSSAKIVWEAGAEPHIGRSFRFTPTRSGEIWVEAEALLPDGRRIPAVAKATVR